MKIDGLQTWLSYGWGATITSGSFCGPMGWRRNISPGTQMAGRSSGGSRRCCRRPLATPWSTGAITCDILGYQDEQCETVVEHILDTAGQKGTGKWPGITDSKTFPRSVPAFTGDKAAFIESIRKALYASKIIFYSQSYTLMRTAAKTYGWNLNYGGIALMWRGGCIIRSVFLGKIKEAYDKNPELENLLLDDYFAETIKALIPAWREVVAYAVSAGIPMPAFTSALSYFDGYTSASLPANLLQAQRNYFGAQTYERTDAPWGQFFHTNWTGHGGNTTANTYQA